MRYSGCKECFIVSITDAVRSATKSCGVDTRSQFTAFKTQSCELPVNNDHLRMILGDSPDNLPHMCLTVAWHRQYKWMLICLPTYWFVLILSCWRVKYDGLTAPNELTTGSVAGNVLRVCLSFYDDAVFTMLNMPIQTRHQIWTSSVYLYCNVILDDTMWMSFYLLRIYSRLFNNQTDI